MDRREVAALALATVLVATAVVGVVVQDDSTTRTAVSARGTDDVAVPAVSGPAADTPAPPGTAAVTGAPSSSATVGAPTGGATDRAVVLPDKPTSGPPLRVGVHLGDNGAAAAQFGVGGLPEISTQEVDAVVKQVNAAGGLGGRAIQPVYHKTDPLSGSFDAQGQRACSALVEDGHVELLIDNALSPSKVLMECAARKHVPLVWELHMVQITDAESSRLGELLYRPSMPNADRLGFVVDGLAESGFFKGAKVGIIRYDSPDSELISKQVFRPRLAAHHIPVVDEYTVVHPDAAAGAGAMSGQASSAVLEFKQKGVTHVLFVPSGGAIPLVFLPNAASQGWYPKYAFTTQDAPDFIAQNFPAAQLADSMSVGWAPDLDGDTPPRNASFRRCQDALKQAGLPWDENIQPFCDAFAFLHASLGTSGGVSISRLSSGAESLGSSFSSPYVFGTRFAPGRHDGPSEARLMRYDAKVSHFVYAGAPVRFG